MKIGDKHLIAKRYSLTKKEEKSIKNFFDKVIRILRWFALGFCTGTAFLIIKGIIK